MTIITVVLLIACLGLTSCGDKKASRQSEPADETPTQPTEQWAEDISYSFEDNVLKTKNAELKITDVKIIEPKGDIGTFDSSASYQGKKLMVFYYDFTNISEKEAESFTVWQDCVIAYQGNMGNLLGISDWRDDNVGGTMADFYDEIEPGITVKSAIAYILENDTTPVTLFATKEQSYIEGDYNAGDIKIGEQIYPVK
jgi:hypothetical protein